MTGIALITVFNLGLMYGSFSYAKETHDAKIEPMELSVKDKQTVNVPIYAGVGAILIRGALVGFRWQERLSSALAPTGEPCQAIAS
jgi:TRAP-type C4-dicarboxylate transport system permease small subunit